MGVITSYQLPGAPSSQSSQKKPRGKAIQEIKEFSRLQGLGSTAQPSLLQKRSRSTSMQTQRIPKSRAAESAARNSAPTRTLKHWMMPYKICRDTGRTAGGQPFFSGEKLQKNVRKHRWTVAILLLHHPIFSHKKTQMLMSNSLAQTRGGLQYPNNNPVAAHVHMHTLNHHTLTTSSFECPPGLFRRFQHKLLRPK